MGDRVIVKTREVVRNIHHYHNSPSNGDGDNGNVGCIMMTILIVLIGVGWGLHKLEEAYPHTWFGALAGQVVAGAFLLIFLIMIICVVNSD